MLRKERMSLQLLYQENYYMSDYKIFFFRCKNINILENFTALEHFLWELIKSENRKLKKRNFHIILEYSPPPNVLPEFELNIESFRINTMHLKDKDYYMGYGLASFNNEMIFYSSFFTMWRFADNLADWNSKEAKDYEPKGYASKWESLYTFLWCTHLDFLYN